MSDLKVQSSRSSVILPFHKKIGFLAQSLEFIAHVFNRKTKFIKL